MATSHGCTYDYPEKKGIVRAELHLGGQVLKPDPANPNKTIMYAMNELDIKGRVPEWAIRTAFKDQGYMIDRIRKCLPKWKKMHPGDRP
jgi:hypothetical protein